MSASDKQRATCSYIGRRRFARWPTNWMTSRQKRGTWCPPFLNAAWQASCDWHHNVVKQLLERMFDRGEIGVDDLWLDSEIALETAARERAK